MNIIVIGAGIAGTCAANYLLRDGHDVVLIDGSPPGSGCSYGNAGSLSAGSCVPLSVPGLLRQLPRWLYDPLGPLRIRKRYLLRALPWLVRFILAGKASEIDAKADAMLNLHRNVIASYTELLKGTGGMDLFRVSGVLQAYKSAKPLDTSLDWRLREARGVSQKIVTATELRDMVPDLSVDYRQGILLPQHGVVVAPQLFVQALAERFVADGGRLVQARVHNFLPPSSGGDVLGIRSALGDMAADRVVLCAGAWSMRLLSSIGINVPLETQRGYHAMALGANVKPPLPIVASEAKIYATPMLEGLRLAGTVEFAGLDAVPDFRRAEAALKLGKEMFPKLEYNGVEEWMGHRPCLPDSLPVIGQVPGIRTLFVNFGHGHYGMTAAPESAILLAALVSERPPPFDPMPYRVDRF